MNIKCKQFPNKGFSLIELIVFIVVIGIVVVAMVIPLNLAAEKSANPMYITIAYELAQERMELILGQRYLFGYANFVDPCTNATKPTICTLPTGYSIAQPTISTLGTNKIITVSVTGPVTGSSVTLKTQVGNY